MPEGNGHDRNGSRGISHSTRLTFAYDGTEVELLSEVTLRKIPPPPSMPEPKLGENSGAWIEIRDSQDEVLYQHRLFRPIRFSAEFKSNDDGLVTRPVSVGQGTFAVLVPRFLAAVSVVLFSSPLSLEKSLLPAEEIRRFELTPERTEQQNVE